MARFVKGDVIVVPFPYTDLSNAKKRPALVITELIGNDVIICQITSHLSRDMYSINLNDSDFEMGSLKHISNIRPNRLVTIDSNIIIKKVGRLRKDKMENVIEKIKYLIQ
jgi:mRNA interferase MazF